ncbi:FG-GAP repeat domain-containing protein [Gorillibacterium sp. sgz500922]|uniref:FG-GAP repeat domain-containing protein n=1 Tax=Gorillibacterium sp. sgz500922 TaxID=3446694 RepID=UPI003F66C93B
MNPKDSPQALTLNRSSACRKLLLTTLCLVLLLAGCKLQNSEGKSGKSIRPSQLTIAFKTVPDKAVTGEEAELVIDLTGPITFDQSEVYIEVKKLVASGSGERIDFALDSSQPGRFAAKHAFAEAGTYKAMIHVYSPEVHKMDNAVFYVEDKPQASASQGQSANTANGQTAAVSAVAAAERTALAAPVLLGSGQDAATRTEIRLEMIQGEEINDPEPGPFEGRSYMGNCELSAYRDGQELYRFALAGKQSFRKLGKPFAIRIADYNGDGQPDFTIGQWAGSNGSTFDLYTAEADGFRLLESGIYTASHADSVLYPMTGKAAFANYYYSHADPVGYFKTVREWQAPAFAKGEPSIAPDTEITAFAESNLT